ncbi:MAG: helix-turn-helix domain-containing protein [Lachnospiraceae bacterium]|nr:helix-turn-helix domain-containing protein [Lachnospiraceae bacterium]
MPKPRSDTGRKNLISENLIELRRHHNLSQRDLAQKLQIAGCDMDKNVIARIETQKRYVTDIETKKLCEVLNTTFEELTNEKEARDN